MPFTDAFRKVSIKQSILTAECRKADQKTWISSSINLDDFLGNVDGKFVLGGKGFSHSAQDITLVDHSFIHAKLKNAAGKYVEAKLDLGTHLSSKDGIIAAHGTGKAQLVLAGEGLERSVSESSALSAASATSMASMASMSSSTSSHATSMTSVSRSSSSSSTHTAFKSSSFRHFSQQLLLEETCSNFILKGTFLHCDVHHEDGRVTHASFDLDLCIGIVNGTLVWDSTGFSKTQKIHFGLDGLILVAQFPIAGFKDLHSARLDLRTRLRIQGGVIILVETNKKLSMMLSEVPWMKFKVIAEPDLSVFSKHPVVQQTMTRIAESTVEHVTMEMHKALTIAMETAIVAITASAMKHVSSQMELTVQDAVGYASASPSATASEFLHIGNAAGLYGYGFAGGAGGAAYAGGYSGGIYAGGANGNENGHGNGHGHGSGSSNGTIHYGGGHMNGGGVQGYNGGVMGSVYGAVSHSASSGMLHRSFSSESKVSASSSEAHSQSVSASASSTNVKQASATNVAAVTQG